MIACLDVHYSEKGACAASVMCEDWDSEAPIYTNTTIIEVIEEYEPGNFYKRELPSILKLLSEMPEKPHELLIDAYCYLSDDGKPGLGARLAEQLTYDIVIIGVAKNRFGDTTHATEVFRGKSKRPLFVTAIGITQDLAAKKVQTMHGENRIPTMLKTVDALSRSCTYAS